MSSFGHSLQKRARRVLESLGLPTLEPAAFEPNRPPRIVLYSSSVVGLGHTARICRIGEELRRRRPELDILLISDGKADVLHQLGPNIAHLRLPNYGLVKDAAGASHEAPGNLSLTKQQMRDLRANIILTTLHGMGPSVFLVDTNPHGKRNELIPALKTFTPARHSCARMLLLRDIPCTPAEDTRINSNEQDISRQHLLYDRILVAGDPAFYPVEQSLGWPADMVRKTRYIGYVVPKTNGRAPHAEPLAPGEKEIVVSFGGGWECEELAVPILQAFRKLLNGGSRPVRLYMSTGPSATEEARRLILAQAEPLRERVELHDFDAAFSDRLANADLAVLQGGSTIFQVLESDIPVLLYSREWKTGEQQERCHRVSKYEGVQLIQREDLSNVDALAARFATLLDSPRAPRRTGISFEGLGNAADAVMEVIDRRARLAPA